MKKTINVLRGDYSRITGEEPAVRWNRKTLMKNILDAEILKAGHAALKESKPAKAGLPNTEFEKLAGDIPIDKIDQAASSEQPVEKRGGPRDGSGRPVGQTDERARIERLLLLEKPDLAVRKLVQGLNLVLEKFTPLPFTSEQVESIALGLTLPLYFWFPSTEGAANKWTLHLQALEYIGGPVAERMNSINQISQPEIIKEPDNGKSIQETEEKQTDNSDPVKEQSRGTKSKPAKKRSARSSRKKKRRSR